MSNFTVVYDACVLYPAPIRDLLLRLAVTDLFRAKWTDEIHEEWIGSLLKNREDLTRERLEQTKNKMNTSVRDCIVKDYEDLIPSIHLPDPDDRHVVAAAIKSGAQVIVTYNQKDFPVNAIGKYNIEVQHPDLFVGHLIDLAPGKIYTVLRQQQSSLKNPETPMAEFLITLERAELLDTVRRLREML